ncbi:MAG: general stress protein CsbD [Ferruginibacter sp.]
MALTTTLPKEENWNEQKAKLKAKFTTLVDADLRYLDGKKDEMMNKLQIKLGKTKDELSKIIAAL